jgi:asparagine synthase (glutamine-hydrolysing)
MCGFKGFLTDRASSPEGLEAVATRMADTIEHRTQDGTGASVDVRLSIIDLSPADHQTMTSDGGRFIIALNDEGCFHPAPIRKKWAEPLADHHDHTDSLWALLTFQAWCKQ